ncbi:MAG: hypothetical protein AAF826_01610, partial [Pseudomonadota bacterium]
MIELPDYRPGNYDVPPRLSEDQAVERIKSGGKTVIFWVSRDLMRGLASGQGEFLNMAEHVTSHHGYAPSVFDLGEKDDVVSQFFNDPNVILFILRSVPNWRADNIIYTIPSYLYGFWYFDPKGARNCSSIRERRFSKGNLSPDRVEDFRQSLWERFVVRN